MDRTKKGNGEIIIEGIFAHLFIGAVIFGILLGLQWLFGILGLIQYQAIIASALSLAWAVSNLEKVPINHCAIKMWMGGRVEEDTNFNEMTDVSGEGWTIRWPFELVTWLPFPTGQQVITIGTKDEPFAVQSGSFRLSEKNKVEKTIVIKPDGTSVATDNSEGGAIYLHVALTVTFHVSSYRILDYSNLKEAENAMVAVITALTRDVILKEEREEVVADPAMICERKDVVEEDLDQRAKGQVDGKPLLNLPDPTHPSLTDEQVAEKNWRPKLLLDNIGVEIESIKIRKIDPDPEVIKAIEQQKMEELGAKSRGTEADGIIERIQKYEKLGIHAGFGAILDLASEFLNIRKGGGKK